MIHRYLVRYMILTLILILCAGTALYFAETPAEPYEDAVLACLADPEIREEANLL